MQNKIKILIVDDDIDFVQDLCELLTKKKFEVFISYSPNEATDILSSTPDISVVLLDLVMPMVNGFELLEKCKEINPLLNIIMISGHGSIPSVVKAIKHGALDYITKPFDEDLLLKKLEIINRTHELENKIRVLKQSINNESGFEKIICNSDVMRKVFNKATAASHSDAPVFIIGETGTGKELLARSIHDKSLRKNNPFVPINCGAIPRDLIESELFGHKKGSFTGAVSDHKGIFMSANSGTVFLDEITEMPKELQVKLLRAIQEKKIKPVGQSDEVLVDIRIIAASNHEIEEIKNKYMRDDLYYRLAVIIIKLPSIRERKEDIPILIDHFRNKFNLKYGRNINSIKEDVLKKLYDYEFPGNIRELENMIEAVVAISSTKKEVIDVKDLSSIISLKKEFNTENKILNLDKLEKFAIEQALRESGGNRSTAAKLLGISRNTLYRKINTLSVNYKVKE